MAHMVIKHKYGNVDVDVRFLNQKKQFRKYVNIVANYQYLSVSNYLAA